MKHPTINQLTSFFAHLGVSHGDLLLIHSDIRLLGMVENGLAGILTALRTAVGDEGTLVMPTFTFSFCRGEVFDVQRTPSGTGVLTEALRTKPDAFRSVHANHSFAAIGLRAREVLTMTDKSSFGPGSVFRNFLRKKAKILLIGTFVNSFVHFVEQKVGVEYRYNKDFHGIVCDKGREYEDTFTMYVRRQDLEGTEEEDRKLAREAFFDSKACRGELFQYGVHRLFWAHDYCDFLMDKLVKDPLYLVDKKKYFASAASLRQRPNGPST